MDDYERIAKDIALSVKEIADIEVRDLLIGQYFVEGKDSFELYFVHRSMYQYFVALSIYDSIQGIMDKGNPCDHFEELQNNFYTQKDSEITSFAKIIGIDFIYEDPDIEQYLLYMLKNRPIKDNSWWKTFLSYFLDKGLTRYVDDYKESSLKCFNKELNRFYNLIWLTREELRNTGEFQSYYKVAEIDEKLCFYVKQDTLKAVDLSEIDLNRADLSGANLNGADLSGSNLNGADLSIANLIGADLSAVDLRGAKLIETKLINTNLSNAELSDTKLIGAKLNGADLNGANLGGINLREVNLREVNLRGADLRGAKLNGANLSEANLSEADLNDTKLIGTNLIGAKLNGANLRGADLRGAKLSGAKLNGAKLRGGKLRGAKLIETDLVGTDLIGTDLTDIFVDKEDLRKAILDKENYIKFFGDESE